MATPFLLLPFTRIEALLLVVDDYKQEDHETTVEVTEYPIESGTPLTTHAVRKPRRLTLHGAVSNIARRPLRGAVGGAQTGTPINERAAIAWQRIEKLLNDREPVDVVTLNGTLRSMLPISAQTTRSRATGLGMKFTLGLREIQFTPPVPSDSESTVVAAEGTVTADRHAAALRGRQQSIEASAATQRRAAIRDDIEQRRRERLEAIRAGR